MQPNTPSITNHEWRWVSIATLIVLLLSLLPVFIVNQTTAPGYQFSGLLVNARDGHSYLAKMRQGYSGEWLYRLAYTAEETDPILIYPLYLGLGHLGRIIPVPLVTLFIAARAVIGTFLLPLLYLLVAQLSADINQRRWMWLVTVAGSGLGIFGLLVGVESADLWIAEAFTFLSLMTNPHFPLTLALLVLILLGVFAWPPTWSPIVRYGLLFAVAVMLAITAPFTVAVLGPALVTGLLMLANQRYRAGKRGLDIIRFPAALAAGVVALGIAIIGIYDIYVLQTNFAVAEFNRQNLTPSPPIGDYLFGFGFLPVLASWAVWQQRRRRDPLFWALVAWLVAVLVLIYTPINLQRRILGGVQLALGPLAGMGVALLVAKLRQGFARTLSLAGLVLGLFATPLLLVILFSFVGQLRPPDPLTFYNADEAAALLWIRETTAPGEVVLAAPSFANFIPAYSDARVVYGHPIEVINGEQKLAWVQGYYAGTLPASEVETLLTSQQVRYVVYGLREDELAGDGPGPDVRDLQIVFTRPTLVIYALP